MSSSTTYSKTSTMFGDERIVLVVLACLGLIACVGFVAIVAIALGQKEPDLEHDADDEAAEEASGSDGKQQPRKVPIALRVLNIKKGRKGYGALHSRGDAGARAAAEDEAEDEEARVALRKLKEAARA